MKLLIQPDDGAVTIVLAIQRARKSIDTGIFRFDRVEIQKAFKAAVARGVPVRALIAHTNAGGEKSLRKLEMSLLEAGHMGQNFLLDDRPRFVDFDLYGMLANFLYSGHYKLPAVHSRLGRWYERMTDINSIGKK